MRPATNKEIWYDRNQRQRLSIMTQITRFSAAREITEEETRKVFSAVYRRVANLRLCFGDRNGERWVRQMPEEKVDVKMIHGAEAHQEYLAMTRFTFNSDTGPLWAARLLPWTQGQGHLESSSNLPEEGSQLFCAPRIPKHPYTYHLITGSNHALSDGFSCVATVRLALLMFGKLLTGESIEDTKPLGEFFDVNLRNKLCEGIAESFQNDDLLHLRRKKALKECFVRPRLVDVELAERNIRPSTDNIFNCINEKATSRFINICKKNSVTVHTAFSSIVNAAIVQILKENKQQQSSNKISSMHYLSQRSFFPNSNQSVGFCVGTFSTVSDVPEDVFSDFWSYAKKNHATIKKRAETRTTLEELVLNESSEFKTLKAPFHVSPNLLEPTTYYYSTTNMLDLTAVLSNYGKNIDVEWLDGMTSIHHGIFMWMHSFYTFRGRFLHSLYYNTALMDRDTAETLVAKIFTTLENLIEDEEK